MSHTPGPWFLDLENDRYITVHAEHRDICDMTTDFGDVAEAEANGRLVAAAPEMLEALEWLSLHSFTAQNSPQVQSAIRKARGEEC